MTLARGFGCVLQSILWILLTIVDVDSADLSPGPELARVGANMDELIGTVSVNAARRAAAAGVGGGGGEPKAMAQPVGVGLELIAGQRGPRSRRGGGRVGAWAAGRTLTVAWHAAELQGRDSPAGSCYCVVGWTLTVA